jgi:hypothetical protein
MQNQMGANFAQTGISSSAVSPQTNPQNGYNDIFYRFEQSIGSDFQNLKNLVQKGVLTQKQGQYLLVQLARKAQELNNYKTEFLSKNNENPQPEKSQMEMFNQERPDFFKGDGRVDVLNYIKDLDMDKDEILQISQLVEKLENSAVDKYLKKSEYEKTLNDENSVAKRKLTAYAQNACSDGKMDKVFTREDIGNMSGEEFTQNEQAIMAQAKQGLIK